MTKRANQPGTFRRLARRYAPGLETLSRYDRSWLPNDLGAGLSVAAIALPIGIAYASLAGVPPVVGMYSAIFPLFAYALFGSSRQLMTGPDAATCIMVAASLGPLSGGDPERYLALLLVLTLMTGVLYVGAGLLRLGFIANFLSQPILNCLRIRVPHHQRWIFADYYVALQLPIFWVHVEAWNLQYVRDNQPANMLRLFALQFVQPLLWSH